MSNNLNNREEFRSRWGFILASIGSAVGMGNIWLFPMRVSQFGGGTFIIPYLICVVLIGYSGIIGEIAFGRAARTGSIGAFGMATERGGYGEKPGRILGLLPVFSSLLLAIGYTVVTGWITKYLIGTFTGSTLAPTSGDEFAGAFGEMASPMGNTIWLIVAAIIFFTILAAGVASGIEKSNKIMMPLFFLLFIGLAVYVYFQPGSEAGYKYIFSLDFEKMMTPEVWIYAMGQAFFSLSLAGSGTVIYGSYLSDNEDIIDTAKYIAIFDTMSAIVASLVIIPGLAIAGQTLEGGGPGLLFISLPYLFSNMKGGSIFAIVFFIAVAFGAYSSIINLYELSIATLQDNFGKSRTTAVAIIAVIGTIVAVFIQGIVGEWMDIVSIYLSPLGAIFAGILFYWVAGKNFARQEIQKGRLKPIGSWLEPLGRYVFVGIAITVYVLGIVLGGIG